MHDQTDNKYFCILPWISVHKCPVGVISACCVSNPNGIGETYNFNNLIELVNMDHMNQLRLDMMQNVRNPQCNVCYRMEYEHGLKHSPRVKANDEYSKYIRHVEKITNNDGSLNDFKLRYYDIRFSNLCNMKCRSCSSGFSSQWEIEDRKHLGIIATDKKQTFDSLLANIFEHIPHMEKAYFAGGEPLITEQHYLVLEEMIRQKRTDIHLNYNSNLSNLFYKDKNLIELWNKFDNNIIISASLDHYGEKAEYIRHGEKWSVVEENYRTLMNSPNVNLSIATTITSLNFVTLGDFIMYFYENNLMPPGGWQANFAHQPDYLCSFVLPSNLKEKGIQKLRYVLDYFKNTNQEIYHNISDFEQAENFVNIEHSWNYMKEQFKSETVRLDLIRNENFTKTFPELAEMMDG